MAFDIEDFKSRGLNLGGARPSLFKVTISDWPANDSGHGQELEFLAKATQIPPSIIGQVEIPYFGRRIKVVGDRVYTNWNITVMNDEDFKVRDAFEEWHRLFNDHQSNLMDPQVGAEPIRYKWNADVVQYGKAGNEIKRYRFVGIFPVSISEIGLDWEAIDQVEQFDVEFSVDYWITQNLDTSLQNQSSQSATPGSITT